MRERVEYVVDTDEMTEAERHAAARTILRLVASERTAFETDIPWSQQSQWVAETEQAAHLLAGLGKRVANPGYQVTGMVRSDDPLVWGAFEVFAPHAYDASVWSGHTRLVSLSDCAASIVATLTETEAVQAAQTLGAQRLVSSKEWRRARRR